MAFFRWLLSAPVAVVVTVGLFIFMAKMISDRDLVLAPEREATRIKITADPPPEGRPTPPKPKPLPKDIPETPLEFPKSSEKPGGIKVDPGKVKVDPTPPGGSGVGIGPIITIAPPYPEGCRSKGAEGVVIVQFDISPEGNVMNPRVIESPDRCFNRPIIKAVQGWKYPPSADGRMRYAMVQRFLFNLEG